MARASILGLLLCAALAGLAFPALTCIEANCTGSEAGDDSLRLLQIHDSAAPRALCKDLADGRLDSLAAKGAPFSEKEVGQIACNMAANIFPNGTILASPSKGVEPVYTFPNGSAYLENDYYNMWQRDAGLTMKTLLRVAKSAPAVQRQLKSYAKLLIRKIWRGVSGGQESPNNDCAPWNMAMGGYCAMFGEPKYFVNGSVYNKGWGRTQNDGPAINVLVLMELLDLPDVDEDLLERAKAQAVQALTWVGYIGLDSTIDPWEMLYGQHFWVQAVMRKAMEAGAGLVKAGKLTGGDTGNFATWTDMFSTLLEVHWKEGALTETVARPNWGPVGPKCLSSGLAASRQRPVAEYEPCELDTAVPIAALVAKAAPDSAFPEVMAPHDSRVLATAQYLVDSMAPYYEVNLKDDALGLPGTLIGRYPGDEYSGVIMSPNFTDPCVGLNCGNPWFLTTNGLAELIYEAARASALGKLSADKTNGRFLLTAIGLAKPAAERYQPVPLPQGEGAGKELAKLLIAGGDGVLERVKHHMLDGMHMSEQIYRGGPNYPPVKAGAQFGVRDLTWSYASLLDALASRQEAVEAL